MHDLLHRNMAVKLIDYSKVKSLANSHKAMNNYVSGHLEVISMKFTGI